jgi:mono/diheme cytochrome c family protein
LTLAISTVAPDATQYDPPVSTPGTVRSRRVLLLLAVFLGVSGLVFALAKWHPARPGLPKAAANEKVALGDFYNGQTVFNQKCAACHGQDGENGSVGPTLAGRTVALGVAKARIDNGGPTMPPKLVSGQQERDVLAFLATIVQAPE